ncbi:MAG: hypothetical protein IJ679_08150 [Lachnospiraceae bacterium]|nr:hypothetical protein [Lachnospiraceae bacterium]
MERRNFVGRPVQSASSANAGCVHSVHIPGARHFRIKQNGQVFIFSGITPNQFKSLGDAKVVGRFSKKNTAPAFASTRKFEITKQMGGQSSSVYFDIYNAGRRFCKPLAYVPIGHDEYLVYEGFAVERVVVPGAVAALAVVIGLLAKANDLPVNPLGIAPTVAIGGDGSDPDAEIEMIDFAGYDSVSVTADDPYVLLQNPESNDVYFSYVLSDEDGKEFKTTDLIPPGKALQWDAKSDLGSGEHVVNMHVDTYDMENTAIPYNAMNYDSVKVMVQ